ncbi:MAG: hypothetical protein ABMA26_11735 [Limisphaerales bacterium]
MGNKNTLIAASAILAILGSITYLYFAEFRGGPAQNMKPFENLGYTVAEETAALLGNQGRVVVVTELMEVQKSPNAEAQIKGFKAGVAKKRGVTLTELKELKRSMDGDPRLWPAGHAEQLVKMGEGSAAVVFFGSLPQEMARGDLALLKGSASKLVFVTAQSPVLKPLLQQGIVHLAVVSRFPPKPAPSGKETPRQWFDRVYMVVKPDALGDLP